MVKWMDEPEAHDFDAAEDYLSLLTDATDASMRRRDLEKYGREAEFKAKDILRASGLALLPEDNKHVAADLKKIHAGKALSPILLFRGELGSHPLIIADGYHRVCASYWVDENTAIPCVIA